MTKNTNKTKHIAGVIVTQFILHMQHRGIWPCKLSFGESPKAMSAENLLKLKDSYISKLD